ncbi:MAG: porin family protein [Bacteroides sp.]|nr:porin family protein [Bacteroides sp.]
MKKIFNVVMVAVALMMVIPVQAQLIKFGVKGGLNMSKIDWKGGYEGNKDNTTGFFIGPMAEITLPVVGLGFDGALMYSQRGKGEVKEQGLEIPVNLKYTIGLGSFAGIYLAAGPDFFFNFKDINLEDIISINGKPTTPETINSKKSQVALNLGAGLKLLKKLQVGITYQIPMGDSFELENLGKGVGKTKTWQVSAAYIF